MSKLDDWLLANQRDVMNPNLMDIGKFPEIRKLFFQQIEDLEFEAIGLDTDIDEEPDAEDITGKSKDGRRFYILSLRLSYPDKSKKPYKFLFDAARRTLVPQYTTTHEVVRTGIYGSDEYNTLTKLVTYLETSLQSVAPKKKTYYVPVSEERDYVSIIHGDATDHTVKFLFTNTSGTSNNIDEIYGHISLYYDNDINNVIATQESDTKGFYITPDFEGLSISVEKSTSDIKIGLSGKCAYPGFVFSKVKAIASYNLKK